MYRKPMKFTQTIIRSENQIVYETPVNSRSQVLEIWLNNTSEYSSESVTIYVNGTSAENILIQNLSIDSKSTKLIEDCRIILEEGESIYISSTAPNVISVTMYGVLEGEIRSVAT